MSENVDIAALAALAHIEVSEAELTELAQELPSILGFVEAITEAGGEVVKEVGEHRTVMREDGEPTPSGTYTEAIVAAMPNSKDGYLRVKKVVKHGR